MDNRRKKYHYSDCYCHNCDLAYHHLGIQRHRAMHRDRKEDTTITYSDGETKTHYFSGLKKNNIQ